MEKAGRERRRLLKTLIVSIGGIGLLWRYFSPRLPRRASLLTVAKAGIPPEGSLIFRESRVAVVRSGDAFYALDLSCTHLGCTVGVTPTELVCPCHGSRFDRHGAVLAGPADRPLRRLVLEERGTELVVLR